MINRKEVDLEIFLTDINRIWKLNLKEEEFLEDTLNLILSRESDNPQKFLNAYLGDDWDEILEEAPNWELERYAEREMGLIPEDECECSEKTLEDFDDDEILEEAQDRNLVLGITEQTDIVSDMQYKELIDIFYNLSFGEREELLNKIR